MYHISLKIDKCINNTFALYLLKGNKHGQKSNEQNNAGRRKIASITVIGLTASGRTCWNDRFEEVHFRLGLTQLIGSLANIVTILSLLNGNNANGGIGKFISCRKMRHTVMLIVRQLNLVLKPHDCWQWVRFDMTLKIHVILQGLTESWTWHGDERCEFYLEIDVTTITFADAIVGNAVVRAAILLMYAVDL